MAGIPRNPQERSDWRCYAPHRDRMPSESKDYVLEVVALATIGQNPRFFRSDIDNPLAPNLAALVVWLSVEPVPLDDAEPPEAAAPISPPDTGPAPPPAVRSRLDLDALRERQ